KFEVKEKIATLNPMYRFSYREFISGYFGTSFLIGKKVFRDVQEEDKTGIYSGLDISLTPLLKGNKVFTSLGLSSAYSDLPKNFADDYWLNSRRLSSGLTFGGSFETSVASYNPVRTSIARNKLLLIALNVGFFNNRVHFIAEWDQLKSENLYPVRVSSYPPSTIYLRGVETTQGLSFAVDARIIDKSRIKWQSRLNLLFPETKLDQVGTASGATPYRSSMRGGWQNKIECNRFFVQVNAMLDLGHAYYQGTFPQTIDKQDDFSLNYVLLGYRASLSKTARSKDLSVFVQARNLFASERLRKLYEYDSYAGIGVDLSF
ncbi:MAG TPA: hypothetical protein VFI06_16220, partial [Chitinophagaceae bacterium]|nr:hypothetical protein [Chitinophagaceae bacterium]